MLALIIYDLSCEPLFSTTDVVLIKKIFIHHHQYRLIFNYYNLCEQEKVVGDFIIINVRFRLLVDDNCTHTHTLVVFFVFFFIPSFFRIYGYFNLLRGDCEDFIITVRFIS